MPRRHEPKSLRESSMMTIARYFDLICYNCSTKAEMRALLDNETYLARQGPFYNMPSSILSDMMDVIEGSTTSVRIERKHLHMLLLPHLQSLKLSPASPANNFAFELMLEKCKKLKQLDISYLFHVNLPNLLQLIPGLPQLTVLIMKMTEITDQVLSLVGKHCPELRELDVSQCPITNAGLCNLCYDREEQKIQSTKLLRINVTGCLVSAESISFLIQMVPTIRELEFENIFQVFEVVKKNRSNKTLDSFPQAFHLNHLVATDDVVNGSCADEAVTLCPFATNVTITNCVIDNETLYKVMTLQNLHHLRITNNDSLSLDFYEGILPILTICGHKLESLLLTKFISVDIHAIGESCPKLKNLAFSSIGVIEEILYARENLFTALSAIEIWTELQSETMNSTILKQLLGFCPTIQNILISGSVALTDKIFTDILGTNKMPALSRLTLDNCPNLSRSPIDHLLDSENKLALIRIWSCFLIAKEDETYLQKRIKNENCDIYLEWYSWVG